MTGMHGTHGDMGWVEWYYPHNIAFVSVSFASPRASGGGEENNGRDNFPVKC